MNNRLGVLRLRRVRNPGLQQRPRVLETINQHSIVAYPSVREILTIEIFPHLHYQDVPLSTCNSLNSPETICVRSTVSQDHGIPRMSRAGFLDWNLCLVDQSLVMLLSHRLSGEEWLGLIPLHFWYQHVVRLWCLVNNLVFQSIYGIFSAISFLTLSSFWPQLHFFLMKYSRSRNSKRDW